MNRLTIGGKYKRYKKCKNCQYRAQDQAVNNCDYILITGKMRNCDPERCDKYVKGKRLQWKDDDSNPRGWNHRQPFLLIGVKK